MRSLLSCVVAGLLLAAVPLGAQGVVTGTVTDPSGRPLSGVLVLVDGTSIRTATDKGLYRAVNVPAGARALTFRYIGYQPVTKTVTVENGRTATLDVKLTEAITALSAIQVRGQVVGQASALNQQRTAPTIASVIDNELVGRLPDPNMAEALARVPGIAVLRDQGEGRFVQIRGTSPNFNGMSVNGLRLATPEQNSRQLPMDIVPSDQASQIQVSKTLTPDMDADAIGGNVNIVTRTARANQPVFNVTAAGGQNQLGGGLLANLGLNAGKRFGASQKFGAMIGGTYYRNDRASQNVEGDWCSQTRNCGVGSSVTSLDAPNLFEYRDYPQVDRLRTGVNGTLDYLLANNGKLFLRGSWNQVNADAIRARARFRFRGGSGSRWTQVTADSGTTTGSQFDRDIRLRKVLQDIYTAQLGGEHYGAGGTAFDWAVGMSRATENRPGALTMGFRQSNMTLGYNFADADRPRAYVVTGSLDDPARFGFNSLANEVRDTRDEDLSAKLNASLPVQFGAFSGTLKGGVAARLKDRANIQTTTNYTSALGTNSLGATGATLMGLLTTETAGRTIFDGDYNFGRTFDPVRMREFIAANPNAFTVNQLSSATTSAGASFKVKENVYAGYLMATLDAGAWRLVPGVRVEATQVENTGNVVRLNTAGSALAEPIRETTATGSYVNVFPSINATYRVGEYTNIKAAITTALVRPQFGDMVPYVNVQVGQQTASIGNPDLKATTAINYDVMVEHYFTNVGFVSVGAFAKSLDYFIFATARARTADDAVGPDATQIVQPVNGPTATLYGFELAWQQNFTFLPGVLKSLGVNANYTRITSTADIPGRGREGADSHIPELAPQAGNIGLFFDRGPVSLRVGGNYSGAFVSTISAISPDADTRTKARFQVDASGSVQLRPGMKLFGEFINLSNTPLRAYVGGRQNRGGGGDDPSYEFYKPWGMLGIKIER
ncbi:MAG: TonB-dependent receptor [Gemmatimonas sp.]|uniref:TonB-dependent receptor n=1 Tax=Gemmatimonas sp. TaxID=1962908 RepID=UPI00391EE5C0